MRLLILSSVFPDHGHFRAAQTVLANLIDEFQKEKACELGLAIASEDNWPPEQLNFFQNLGVKILGGDKFQLKPITDEVKFFKKWRYLKTLFSRSLDADYPKFKTPEKALKEIIEFNPDAVILFWDTYFEYLLPSLYESGVKCYGYLARPPYAARKSRISEVRGFFRRKFAQLYLSFAEKRHLRRLSYLIDSANICAIDAKWYQANNIKSRYIPNTWPDFYGSSWKDMRKIAESSRVNLHLLGNIGGLNGTGNIFGLRYLGLSILPLLRLRLKKAWVINICGRFELPQDLKKILNVEGVNLKGFVEDIEEEILGNAIFLLLNNAGPYSGGYTRVMFAFSAGSCLVAHKKLAQSMPELIHEVNCLLGETPEEIVDLILRVANDLELRESLGSAARKTYQDFYRPKVVVREILRMVCGNTINGN